MPFDGLEHSSLNGKHSSAALRDVSFDPGSKLKFGFETIGEVAVEFPVRSIVGKPDDLNGALKDAAIDNGRRLPEFSLMGKRDVRQHQPCAPVQQTD
jgi:hypothetical protein